MYAPCDATTWSPEMYLSPEAAEAVSGYELHARHTNPPAEDKPQAQSTYADAIPHMRHTKTTSRKQTPGLKYLR